MNKIIWKKIHNYFGLASALFLVLLLATGILLNHAPWFEGNETTVIAADPQVQGRIFQGRKDGLFASLDGGKSWDEVPMLYPPQNVSDIKFYGNEIFLTEKWGKVIASSDGGKIWRSIEVPFDPKTGGIELKNISQGEDHSLILFTSHGWLSTRDDGQTWDETHFNKLARPFRRLVLAIHNGYFFGPRFVWLYDFSAVALLILILSGLVLWNAGRSAA